jgi:hypothetical protein
MKRSTLITVGIGGFIAYSLLSKANAKVAQLKRPLPPGALDGFVDPYTLGLGAVGCVDGLGCNDGVGCMGVGCLEGLGCDGMGDMGDMDGLGRFSFKKAVSKITAPVTKQLKKVAAPVVKQLKKDVKVLKKVAAPVTKQLKKDANFIKKSLKRDLAVATFKPLRGRKGGGGEPSSDISPDGQIIYQD